jgi:hypothetical protein
MLSPIRLSLCILLIFTSVSFGQPDRQRQRSRGGGPSSVPDHPQQVGDAGIAWYTTWETGLAEAKRTNRPIFFMSAATVCSGISGVF